MANLSHKCLTHPIKSRTLTELTGGIYISGRSQQHRHQWLRGCFRGQPRHHLPLLPPPTITPRTLQLGISPPPPAFPKPAAPTPAEAGELDLQRRLLKRMVDKAVRYIRTVDRDLQQHPLQLDAVTNAAERSLILRKRAAVLLPSSPQGRPGTGVAVETGLGERVSSKPTVQCVWHRLCTDRFLSHNFGWSGSSKKTECFTLNSLRWH